MEHFLLICSISRRGTTAKNSSAKDAEVQGNCRAAVLCYFCSSLRQFKTLVSFLESCFVCCKMFMLQIFQFCFGNKFCRSELLRCFPQVLFFRLLYLIPNVVLPSDRVKCSSSLSSTWIFQITASMHFYRLIL